MNMVPLGEVTSLLSGGTPDRKNSSFYDGDIPWITGADIDVDGQIHPRHHITKTAINKSATRVAPDNTVLLVTRTAVGKTAVPNFPVAFSQDLTALTPHAGLDLGYLDHFLRSRVDYFARNSRGATIKGVTRRVVSELPIPLPPLDEQRRIVAILDKADAIRQKRRQAIAHLDTLTQSIFHDMFASIQDTETVANLAAKSKRSIRTGPFGSQLLHEEFTSEGVPVLGIDNVVENKFMWKKERYIDESKFHQLEKYEVFPDDVLITIMGTTGRCAVVPIGIPRSINTKHICAITPDTEKVLPEFLKAAFLYHPATQRFLKDNTRGAIMAGLNMGIIKKTPLPLASLSDQKTFVERSQRIDTFRTRLLIGHNSDLFASLQSRAFRGEL
jgi:type I restriction enzyme S subunit